jgi:Fic family protein
MRDDIIAAFPEPPGLPTDKAGYLKRVDEVYTSDAYHSLSIEGYRVNVELIERARDGSWNPDQIEQDRKHRDTIAARGYWLAFQEVKKSVERILDRQNPGDVAERGHGDWFRALFTPGVEANILAAGDLAGYRGDPVFIRNSKHVPPKKDAILDCMTALFDHLRDEDNPAVRIVLGHWVFVYIHPYMDGNGRVGRFLMNAMLASGGYAWTVIPVSRRNEYMTALEEASVNNNIKPFAAFLAGLQSKWTGN